MSWRIGMNIPQAGKEGYLIKVTPENYLEMFEMIPELEPHNEYVNYDPNHSIPLVLVSSSTRSSVFIETSLITLEELKTLFFIDSLEK